MMWCTHRHMQFKSPGFLIWYNLRSPGAWLSNHQPANALRCAGKMTTFTQSIPLRTHTQQNFLQLWWLFGLLGMFCAHWYNMAFCCWIFRLVCPFFVKTLKILHFCWKEGNKNYFILCSGVVLAVSQLKILHIQRSCRVCAKGWYKWELRCANMHPWDDMTCKGRAALCTRERGLCRFSAWPEDGNVESFLERGMKRTNCCHIQKEKNKNKTFVVGKLQQATEMTEAWALKLGSKCCKAKSKKN